MRHAAARIGIGSWWRLGQLEIFGNLQLGALEGLAGTFTLTLSDALGRTGTAAVRVVLHDEIACQDLGPGLCIPYGEAGVDGGGAGATDAGP